MVLIIMLLYLCLHAVTKDVAGPNSYSLTCNFSRLKADDFTCVTVKSPNSEPCKIGSNLPCEKRLADRGTICQKIPDNNFNASTNCRINNSVVVVVCCRLNGEEDCSPERKCFMLPVPVGPAMHPYIYSTLVICTVLI